MMFPHNNFAKILVGFSGVVHYGKAYTPLATLKSIADKQSGIWCKYNLHLPGDFHMTFSS
jgi:hypothetical protein